ncbi:hypothetical protein HGRIS_013157 [Hohenbuehelia grisea]|uniref:BD-FAE-like domain-containing protein n=1 Tax=Hohenbuehelia grisea TaxID=104357 RepID=A0ABR3IUQ9_9AGAR
MVKHFLNIPYVQSSELPTHQFDIYVPNVDNPAARPLICFIHGGAWRAEDKAHHAEFARKLCTLTSCAVAVPNYRLTPNNPAEDEDVFRHPGHAEDALSFLSFAIAWDGTPGLGRLYDSAQIFVIGHSCSAHMLASIFLDSSAATPSLSPSPSLLASVQAIILSEGIYDLDMLLVRFPAYREWFILNAFGNLDAYEPFSVTHLPLRSSTPRWHLIHSRMDSLVDIPQTEAMFAHLTSLVHDPSKVTKDLDSITEEHNDMLKGDNYIRVVGNYIKGCTGVI